MKTREEKILTTKNISKKLYVKLDDLIYPDIDENGRHEAQEPMPKPTDILYVSNVLSVEYKATQRPKLK